MHDDFLSLSELNGLIKEVFEMNFLDDIWLVAEIAEMRVAGAGHCYLELVEKKNNKIVARIRANIWNFQYQRISSNFFASTGSTLKKGMKVLLSVAVSFHELYGVSLVVKNIDPSYSLGELERRKKEILDQLAREGLMQRNSSIELELVPKRVAVISSETAAGYGDFLNQIQNNPNNYLVETRLFPATMQGDSVGHSIIAALNSVHHLDFDCVVIIRGGGASLDLAGFDNYNLAKEIANYPIPVLTGIGHERDDTVIDHVSHTKLKTPTAVAEFILERYSGFEEYIAGLREGLLYMTREKIVRNKALLKDLMHELSNGTGKRIEKERLKINSFKVGLPAGVKQLFIKRSNELKKVGIGIQNSKSTLFNSERLRLVKFQGLLQQRINNRLSIEKNKLEIHRKTIQLIHPDNVLKRGYSIVYKENKIQKETKGLRVGDELIVKMKDGDISTKVI